MAALQKDEHICKFHKSLIDKGVDFVKKVLLLDDAVSNESKSLLADKHCSLSNDHRANSYTDGGDLEQKMVIDQEDPGLSEITGGNRGASLSSFISLDESDDGGKATRSATGRQRDGSVSSYTSLDESDDGGKSKRSATGGNRGASVSSYISLDESNDGGKATRSATGRQTDSSVSDYSKNLDQSVSAGNKRSIASHYKQASIFDYSTGLDDLPDVDTMVSMF